VPIGEGSAESEGAQARLLPPESDKRPGRRDLKPASVMVGRLTETVWPFRKVDCAGIFLGSPMRFLPLGPLVLLFGSCVHDLSGVAAADLSCARDNVRLEQGANRLIARGCGKRATYTYVALRRQYVLDGIESDSEPLPGPREPLPAQDNPPCSSDTDCTGDLVCRNSRCAR